MYTDKRKKTAMEIMRYEMTEDACYCEEGIEEIEERVTRQIHKNRERKRVKK